MAPAEAISGCATTEERPIRARRAVPTPRPVAESGRDADQKRGLSQQRFDVDRTRQKTASIPLERVAAMQRASGITEKQNVDPLRSRNRPQARDLVERPFRVDVQQDERRHLHGDARDQQRKRHVDDRVPLAAERSREPVGLCRRIAHENRGRSLARWFGIVEVRRLSAHACLLMLARAKCSRRRSRLAVVVRVSPPKAGLPQPPRKFSASGRGT